MAGDTHGSSDVWSLCEEVFDWRLVEYPEFATYCGEHRYDDRLNDHSIAAFERRQVAVEQFLCRVTQLEQSLSGDSDESLNLQLLKCDLTTFLTGLQFKGYLFPLSSNEGVHVDFEQLVTWMPFNTQHDYNNYMQRLKALPARIASDITLLRQAISIGYMHSIHSVNGVPDALQTLMKSAPEETLFYQPLQSDGSKLEEAALHVLQSEALSVIQLQIQPALRDLYNVFTQEYMVACRPKPGVSCIPDGDAWYRTVLQWHTSPEHTPQSVHDLGLTEVQRIRAQMCQVMSEVGFQGDLKSFIKHLQADPASYFATSDECLEGFRHLCYDVIRPALPKLFNKIPITKMEIVRIPDSRRSAPWAYYLAGTQDGTRPGRYYVNTHNLKACIKYNMTTLSLHEGEPGHHFQGMYAIESTKLPRFRRFIEDMYYSQAPSKFPIHTAYCEGWALYCETLGQELGLYSDPYIRFGFLTYEMLRATRLVIDTGLHAFGWSHEQAVQFALENVNLTEDSIRGEVNRYLCWPGQACAYKLGQLKIMELRNKASRELGDKFDVRQFHDEVLKCGLVPLNALDLVVQQYINRTAGEHST